MNKGIIYILVTAFAFSTMEIVGKMISTVINPFQITFIRFFIGGIILLPFALREIKRKKMNLKLKDYGFFLLSGFFAIVVSMSFFQIAVLNTKASIVAVIFSTNPIFTIPFACLFLKEKLHRSMAFSLAASIAGILLIFNPFSINPDIKGIVYAVIAAVTFSLYTVINKPKIEKYGGLVLNCFSFLIGDALLLLCLLYFKIPVIAGISSSNIWHLLYLGIFVTGIGYWSYFEGMKKTSAITASTVFFIKPALAPILSLIILNEGIKLNTGLGITFILIGALINYVPKLKKNQIAV
jgi:drug/metabolite transporter (DMT)-like permease